MEAEDYGEIKELSERLEAELAEISGNEQQNQAIINLANMISNVYKAMLAQGLDVNVAVVFTQTYIETTVKAMMK